MDEPSRVVEPSRAAAVLGKAAAAGQRPTGLVEHKEEGTFAEVGAEAEAEAGAEAEGMPVAA